MIKKLWAWMRAIARWLWDGRQGWSPIVVVAGVVLPCVMGARTLADGLRFAGLFLQLLGVVTVAIGLRDRRQTFQRPGLVQHLLQWIKSFPHYSPKPHIVSLQGVGSVSAIGSVSAYGWRGTPANATTDERFAILEKNVDTVKQLALDAQKQTQEAAAKIHEEIGAERRDRSASDEALRLRLENVGAGNLNLEAAGVFWLIVGITLGTVPGEIATWSQR